MSGEVTTRTREEAIVRARATGTLTTGMLGQIVRISARVVSRWCDDGLLPSYRIPKVSTSKQGNQRRIRLPDAAKFLREHQMGAEADELDRAVRVAFGVYAGELPADVTHFDSAFDFGRGFAKAMPTHALLGDGHGLSAMERAAGAVLQANRGASVVLLVSEVNGDYVAPHAVAAVLFRPVDVAAELAKVWG